MSAFTPETPAEIAEQDWRDGMMLREAKAMQPSLLIVEWEADPYGWWHWSVWMHKDGREASFTHEWLSHAIRECMYELRKAAD